MGFWFHEKRKTKFLLTDEIVFNNCTKNQYFINILDSEPNYKLIILLENYV